MIGQKLRVYVASRSKYDDVARKSSYRIEARSRKGELEDPKGRKEKASGKKTQQV